MPNRPDDFFAVRVALPRNTRLLLLVIAPAVVLLAWVVLTLGEHPLVPPDFLPAPVEVIRGTLQLFIDQNLAQAIAVSSYRIGVAFALSVVVALPLGILMGAFPPVEAFFEPIMAPLRYMPISAFIPLLILWFGIYEKEKIAFLFLGTFVYLLPVVVTAIKAVPDELIHTALTLGASRRQVVTSVLIPAAMPDIFDSFRVMNAIAWTYVVLAELVNAEGGLGYIVELARRYNRPSWMFAGVLVIGGIGILTDLLIRTLSGIFFKWREAT